MCINAHTKKTVNCLFLVAVFSNQSFEFLDVLAAFGITFCFHIWQYFYIYFLFIGCFVEQLKPKSLLLLFIFYYFPFYYLLITTSLLFRHDLTSTQ